MNKRAHKCLNCKRTYEASKIDQKFCSHRCRQANYCKRKLTKARRLQKATARPLIPTTCLNCRGTFWAKTSRAMFCSTSCRTLHHRALKAAIPNAIYLVYGLPEDKALDIIETQSVGKIRAILQASGYSYSHTQRRWIAQQ